MEETIRNMLANAFDDEGNFDERGFCHALRHAGHRVPSIRRDNLHALAAAIEYYDGDIDKAIASIERGDYRHCPDAQTYEDLGWELLREETNVDRLPQLVVDYMDFEALGENAEHAEQGKFTHFGYFAPERW